jgi:hypothetical protein
MVTRFTNRPKHILLSQTIAILVGIIIILVIVTGPA